MGLSYKYVNIWDNEKWSITLGSNFKMSLDKTTNKKCYEWQ